MEQKTRLIRIIIILIAAVAMFAAFLIFTRITKRSKTDDPITEYEPNVVFFYYYYGGGEYGESTSYSIKDFQLKRNIDGGTVGESSSVSTSFLIGDYNALDEIVEKYDMINWANLPESDLEILDGATTSVKIEFRDGTVVELGDDYEMPENGWEAVHSIMCLIESCLEADE